MAQSVIAVGGKWKNSGSLYVAVGGKWKRVNTAYTAVSGKWKSGYASVPQGSVTLTLPGSASWSRIVYSCTAKGTWTSMVLTIVPTDGSTGPTQLASWGPVVESTITLAATETPFVLVPTKAYRVDLTATTSGGQTVVIATSTIATGAPPVITSFGLHGSTHNSGGVYWGQPRDIDAWNNVNDSLGTSWNQSGNDTQIWYGSGLSANTRYYVRTRAICKGVYGGFSPQVSFVTAPPPYNPGDYYLYPNGNSQTYQSGGSQGTSWQGGGRSEWYHGNGSNWGSTRGTQRTCIYYDRNADMQNIVNAINNGASVTGCWVYVHRANVDAGNGGAVGSLIGLNGTNYPSAPSNISGNQGGPGHAKGTGAWVGVPAHWGYHIVMQNVTSYGWILGDSTNLNNYMALGKSNYSTGHMRLSLA